MKKLQITRGYRKARTLEYPPLQEFADAYYWQQRGDPKPMQDYLAKIDEIKQRHPKDNKK